MARVADEPKLGNGQTQRHASLQSIRPGYFRGDRGPRHRARAPEATRSTVVRREARRAEWTTCRAHDIACFLAHQGAAEAQAGRGGHGILDSVAGEGRHRRVTITWDHE